MKKVKISPSANVITVETLKSKFERLASGVGDNGLTPNFQYGLNPYSTGRYSVRSMNHLCIVVTTMS